MGINRIINFGVINLVDNRNWLPQRVYKVDVSNVSSFFRGNDEQLTLETTVLEILHGGQFAFSTQLLKPNYPYQKWFSVRLMRCGENDGGLESTKDALELTALQAIDSSLLSTLQSSEGLHI